MFRQLIKTPRLILKETSLDDFQRFFSMSKDPAVMRYIGDGSIFHWTKETALEKFILSLSTEQTEPHFEAAVYRADINLYIGWCRVSYSKFLNQTGIEYRLCRDSWGNGYATEAVSAVLNEMLANSETDKIFACAHPGNTGSMRVLEKLGFQFRNTKLSGASGKQIQIFSVDRVTFISSEERCRLKRMNNII